MKTLPSQKAWQPACVLLVSMAVALMALAAGVLRAFDPASAWFFPPCPFRALTGFLCPGCGTLRGLHELLRGHVAAALRLNPLMVLSLPFIGCSSASSAVEALTGRRLLRVFVPPACIWMLLAMIVLFWILRNTPLFTTA